MSEVAQAWQLTRPLWIVFSFICFAPSARAHDVRGTVVLLDIGTENIAAELQIPVPELRAALKLPRQQSGLDGAALAPTSELRAYVRRHFGALSSTGQAFELRVQDVGLEQIDDGECIVARTTLHAPGGTTARRFMLQTDLVVHEVVSHNLYVFVRRDLESGLVDTQPELLGMLHYQEKSLSVDRSQGSAATGFYSAFRLGMRHIAEGGDHLMFLLVLLLPAPLLCARGRWAGPRPVRQSLVQIAKVVSAFTVGHSLTLLLGVFAATSVPTRGVEALIAVSIFVSALHAIVPLFAGREAWLAAGFGLVHGLAFASVLSGLSVDLETRVLSLLAFNLGIEAMQLAVIAVTMPWFVLLSRRALYAALRISLAVLSALVALALTAERSLDYVTPLSVGLEHASGYGVWLIVLLALLALVTRFLPGAPAAS